MSPARDVVVCTLGPGPPSLVEVCWVVHLVGVLYSRGDGGEAFERGEGDQDECHAFHYGDGGAGWFVGKERVGMSDGMDVDVVRDGGGDGGVRGGRYGN